MRPRLSWLAFLLVGYGAWAQAPNPLGVEWVTGQPASRPLTPTPAAPPAGNNPLGVEWKGGGTPSHSAPVPATTPAGSNPLGVEWQGGASRPAPPAPAPSGSNPLGIEWRGGTAAPPVQPSPSAPTAPAVPAPSPPLPPVDAPLPDTRGGHTVPNPPPPPAAGTTSLALALVDTWMYQAVAFSDARGTVSETRGVSGSLRFKDDGQYEQALSIGGILNAIKGSYRVVGHRLETRYLWRGEATVDTFEMYLDPTGKLLTLSGQRSPYARYTLRRAD